MEELLLGLLASGDELHVVHQQQIRLAVLLPHLGGLAGTGLNGGHQFVGEVVALDVGDLGGGVVAADDVGDGVDQVGLAKAGVPVDQQGVVVLGGMLRNRHRRRVGQLVGGAHHEGLEGELVGGKTVALLMGRGAVELRVGKVVQDPHFKVRGENVVQGRLDVFHEQGLDIALFKVVGTVEDKGIPPDVHRLQLVEPGGDGGLGEIAPELRQHVLPYVGHGIQTETPLSKSMVSRK